MQKNFVGTPVQGCLKKQGFAAGLFVFHPILLKILQNNNNYMFFLSTRHFFTKRKKYDTCCSFMKFNLEKLEKPLI